MAYDRIIRLGSFFFENGSFCGMRKRSRVSIRVPNWCGKHSERRRIRDVEGSEGKLEELV